MYASRIVLVVTPHLISGSPNQTHTRFVKMQYLGRIGKYMDFANNILIVNLLFTFQKGKMK